MTKKAARKAAKRSPTTDDGSKGSLEVVYLPLASLREDPKNARTHDDVNLDTIRASVARDGVYQPIVVQKKTRRIIAGHARKVVFAERGVDPAPCILLDVDDAVARRIGVADNRTAELAGWDGAKLDALLKEFQAEFDLTPVEFGFTSEDLAKLVPEPEEDEGDEAGDHTPAPTSFKVIVHTKDAADQEKLLKRLRKQGFKCHSMTS